MFLVDTTPFADDEDLSKEEQEALNGFKRVFINAKIVKEEGDEWAFNEGCLSIPDVREDVFRQPTITVEYLDENFKSQFMSLDKVISISGKPGLYKLITQTRGGFVAESLMDNKRISVSVQNNVSVLSEIAIYTLTEEVPLREVLEKIKKKEDGKPASVKPKDSKDKLEEYFFDLVVSFNS